MRDFLRWFPEFRRLEKEQARLRQVESELAKAQAQITEWSRFAPPGHFYSPLPSLAEIDEGFKNGIFGPPFGGVDLNEAEQFARLERFAGYYGAQPFQEKPAVGRRFYLDNPSYGHHDAMMLYGMLREAQPARIIEVGSGFSSAAMLDLNDLVFSGRIQFTFIDPDMVRLKPLLHEGDGTRVTLIERRVQEVPVAAFATLAENDVLFIDSSHVSKFGSDVNRLFFDILPTLAAGVLIHIHDIAGNLEYPRDWLESGRAWNEQYLLRAFLMNNRDYRIELFSSWLSNQRREWLSEKMPMCARGGGGQIWLRKLSR